MPILFGSMFHSFARARTRRIASRASLTASASSLPQLDLSFGPTSAHLTNVDVTDDHQTDRHGSLGLDTLRTAPGYVLDFEAMRFELLPEAP